jgi:maltose-binding protein MalE
MKQYLGGRAIGIIALAVIMATTTLTVQSSYAAGKRDTSGMPAVIATSDENVYVVWGNNNTDNNTEIMFRASNDGGQSYSNKINLSNSSSSNSTDFDIEATDNNVIVSWWETNATSAEPGIIFSNDHGRTFGPIMRLASNGTIGGSLR